MSQSKHTDVAQERDTLVKEARELGLQLANTREQLETHKQLLGTRRQPTDELVDECKTLRVSDTHTHTHTHTPRFCVQVTVAAVGSPPHM